MGESNKSLSVCKFLNRFEPNPREYFYELRQIIINEYTSSGKCGLVDHLLEMKMDIDLVTFECIKDACGMIQRAIVKVDFDIDTYGNRPFFRDSMSWVSQELSTTIAYKKVKRDLEMINKAGREYYGKKQKNLNVGGNLKILLGDVKPAPIEIGQTSPEKKVNDQDASILEKARQEAAMILAEAEKERDEILKSADYGADRRRHEAEIQAQEIVNRAQNQAATIIRRADEESVEKVRLAEARAKRIKDDSESRVKETINSYLATERNSRITQIETNIRSSLEKSNESLGKIEAVHNEMCDITNELQRAWALSINSSMEELKEMQNSLYSHMRTWQTSLYLNELRPLAQSYVDLYRIVNIDKLFTDEIFDLTVTEKDDARVSLETSSTLKGLNKLNENLNFFLKRFEAALRAFDMYIFMPEYGQKFDEVWHVVEDDRDFDNAGDPRILSCIIPGVAKKFLVDNGDKEDQVIIRAVVAAK